MPKKIAERLTWAIELMAVKPADHLLEIGCGHGVAVSLVCDRLDSGTITAIDRSEAMLRAARKRNRDCIAAGKVTVRVGALAEVDFGNQHFSKIFAVNVSSVWKNPSSHFAIIQKLLVLHGRLYLFYQPPYWDVNEEQEFANSLSKVLAENGFVIHDVLIQELEPVAAVCVIAGVS